jgi:Ca2+-binding EF-hand superfamily protein
VLRGKIVILAAAVLAASAASAQQAAPKSLTRSGISSRLDTVFASADANHDGALNTAEITAFQNRELQQLIAQARSQLQTTFKQLDTNKDGQLSLQEYLASANGAKLKVTATQVLQTLDTNHDGKVSAAEYKAPTLTAFDRADLNHDGTVTPDEARRAAAGQK